MGWGRSPARRHRGILAMIASSRWRIVAFRLLGSIVLAIALIGMPLVATSEETDPTTGVLNEESGNQSAPEPTQAPKPSPPTPIPPTETSVSATQLPEPTTIPSLESTVTDATVSTPTPSETHESVPSATAWPAQDTLTAVS